jgi:hypothetical protein
MKLHEFLVKSLIWNEIKVFFFALSLSLSLSLSLLISFFSFLFFLFFLSFLSFLFFSLLFFPRPSTKHWRRRSYEITAVSSRLKASASQASTRRSIAFIICHSFFCP